MAHFGERLRLLRGDRSQKEVARALGMPQTTLSTLENQAAVPRGEVLQRLADFFGTGVDYFFPTGSIRPSSAARAYLRAIRHATPDSKTVVAHSTLQLDGETKSKIHERIRQKRAQTTNKR